MSNHRPTVAVLASGGGSTAEAYINATQDGRVDAEVGLVICSKPVGEAGIYERIARLNKIHRLGIEIVHISGLTNPCGNVGRGQTLSESEAICQKVAAGNYAHVALMGYMRLVRGDLLDEYGWKAGYSSIYRGRMSNTHPGPLPETEDTYGIHTSEKVLELGLPISKHTLHIVSGEMDKGPIIAQHPVEVLAGDSAQSLFDRVQVVEKAALPYALGKFLMEQEQCNGNS